MSSFEDKEKQAKGLTRQLEILTETTDSFAQSVIDASNESKKWTAVSRFLSGSGLWRLQNYLRGALQVMSFFNDSQREAIEANIKQAQALSDLYDVQEESQKQMKLINKIRENGIDILNDESLANDEVALAIKKQYDVIRKTLERANDTRQISMTQEQMHQEAIRRTSTAYEYVANVVDKTEKSRTKKLANSIKRRMKLHKKDVNQYKINAISKMKEQRKAAMEAGGGIGGQITRVARIRAGTASKEERNLQKKIDGLSKSINKRRLQAIRQNKVMTVLTLGLTRGTTKGLGEEATRRQKLMQILKTSPIGKGVINMREQIEKQGGPMKILGKVGKFAMTYSLYFLLFIMGAFVVFSFIREIFKNAEVMNTVMTALKEIFGAVFLVLSGFFDIFQAFFGEGTFGERLLMLVQGFAKIFGGLGGILMAVLKGILKLAVGLLVGIVMTYVNMITKILHVLTNFDNYKKKLGEWWKGLDLWNRFTGWLGGLWERVTGFFGNLFDNFFNPFANGGVVTGGMSIVGERGPELVNLPRGSRVHSNSASKNMLANSGNTTINVSVNGRMGASDSELRDIAKKIGRMVNTEINRTTSSSTNVRY